MTLRINGTTVVNTDRSITLGTATPGTPVTGMMRYNSTLPEFQVYDGAAWVPFTKTAASSSLFAWGRNLYGTLGDNTEINASSPVPVAGGFGDWVSVKIGDRSSLGLRANGRLYAWGKNSAGTLGDGSTADKSSPVLVAGGITDWKQCALGNGYHGLAVRANGELYAWGMNIFGELGDGGTTGTSSPVLVAGGIVNWVSAGAGNFHSIGLRADGTLYGWGSNSTGVVGDGSTADKSSPVLVAGGIVNWASIECGTIHNLAIRATGQLYAWGYNSVGQLGDSSTANKSSPVLVAGGIVNWIQASAGGQHSLGLRATGQLYGWGYNTNGAIGNNATTPRSSPVLVAGGITDWVSASAGGQHSLGLRATGQLYAWGYGGQGQLGDVTTLASSPILVAGGFTDWVQTSGGYQSSAGIRA